MTAMDAARANRALFLIGAMRLIDSMNVTMIYPYGLEMVALFLEKPTESPEVGTAYAWFVGMFSLFEIIFSPLWGMVADIIGRKPCLLMGMMGTAICPVLLGLGHSLSVALLFRGLCGVFCGNQAILRTYLGELVEKNEEARAFGMLVLCFVLGLMVGPLLGGMAFPARWAPHLFADTIFDVYPILLPNLLFGVLAVLVCLMGFSLKETLPKSERCVRRKIQSDEESSESSEAVGGWCYPRTVFQAMLSFCGLAGAVEAQNTILVLLWQYPIASGGFGFNPQQVSLVQISGSVGPILCHLKFFRSLVKNLGFLKVLLLGFLINSACYGLYPFYGLFAAEKYAVWRYVILCLAELIGMTGTFLLFSAVFVFMNRASEGLNRATVNGWANSGRALSRAVSPLIASQILNATATAGPIGRYIPLCVTSGSLALCVAISWTGLQKLNEKF